MLETTSATGSLWLDTAPGSGYPALQGEIDVDVAIAGGGVAGLTTALLLKRGGARVAVLEAARIGTGVTGCTTAKVSALQATMYSTITVEEGIDCDLQPQPAFTYAADESERRSVEREFDAARTAGLPVEWVDDVDLPYAVRGAVRLGDQLQLHLVRYVQGMATAVVGDGSHVFENTRVLKASEGSPARVATATGAIVAEHVVVATHYPILDRGFYFARLKSERSYCIAVRLAAGKLPKGMAISAGSNSRSIRSCGDLLLLGGEGHPAGSDKAKPARFERLEAFAREHWDVSAVTHRWSAHDPIPYDHLPMIGRYQPRSSRLWVTTSFMKWGLSTATFGAMILADQILGRENSWAPTFSPNRLSLSLRSAHEVMQLGAQFTAELVGNRLRPPQAFSADNIPRGQARVVQDGLGKKGAYRDETGELHAVSLRCTHLGCLLRFNAAERSWDCPCHGSRFAPDGAVLEGPAVHPLQRRDP